MTGWARKRFWKEATVEAEGDGWKVTLDGRDLRTPAKALLVLPTRALAEEVAAEWQAQEGEIDPLSMPFTRSANAAIDKVAVQQGEVAAMLAEYGETDLLCYRAEEPQGLIARQAKGWDPLLDWAATELGARLVPATGVMFAAQDAAALQALRARVDRLDPFTMAGFHDLVSLSGSLIIGFAALERAWPVATLWSLSRIDEDWQIAQWGEDDEATTQARKREEAFHHAARFCELAQKTA